MTTFRSDTLGTSASIGREPESPISRRQAAKSILVTVGIMGSGCQTTPDLVAYRSAEWAGHLQTAPVVVAGQICKFSYVGRPHATRSDAGQQIQICELSIKIENVFTGDVRVGVSPIYYLIDTLASEGPPRKGMLGRGGHWKIGERAVLFLRRDSGSVPWLNDCTQIYADVDPSISVMVVGRIVSSAAVRQEHGSCRDKYFTVQLYRVTVAIENVLRGEGIPKAVEIYYFSGVGSNGGPARLGMRENGGRWKIGDRELFLLRVDSGVLRTKCDQLATCAYHVFTGPHPDFLPYPAKPIEYSLVRLLLSRGAGFNDKQMIAAIESNRAWHISENYTIERLLEIAQTETPEVRAAACQDLVDVSTINRPSIPGLTQTCPSYKPKEK